MAFSVLVTYINSPVMSREVSEFREGEKRTHWLEWTKADLQCSGLLLLQAVCVPWETEKEALPHRPLAAAASLSPSLCTHSTSWLLNHSCFWLQAAASQSGRRRDSTSLPYFPLPDSGAPPFRGSLWKSVFHPSTLLHFHSSHCCLHLSFKAFVSVSSMFLN